MFRFVLPVLALFPLAARAESPLTPEEFEARVTGRTLTYSADGMAYGAEEYLEGRRVRWSYLDGECQDGHWYVSGQQICFIYEGISGPQCWQFYSRDGQIMARFENDPVQTELYETSKTDEALFCLGPKVGA